MLAIVVSIKAVLFLFAVQSYQVLQNQRVVECVAGWRFGIVGTLSTIKRLAQFGYSATGELQPLLVFYPLYPWTVRLFALVTRDYLVSAFIVSTLASLVTAIVLMRLVELDYPKDLAATRGMVLIHLSHQLFSCTSVTPKACFSCWR